MARIRFKEKRRNGKAVGELRALAAAPRVDWIQQLAHHARGTAEAMEAIHGGHWNIAVNHETCFVLISRQRDCLRS